MIGLHNHHQHDTPDLSIDLTPLIDVLFMLLVFFLLTANSVPYSLDLDLPQEQSSAAKAFQDKQHIRLEITQGESPWRIDGKPQANWQATQSLILEMQAERPDAPVLIAGEREAALEHLVNVIAFLGEQGIPVAQIMLNPYQE